ncbi:MAG TPA: VCBS repeat-containing protein [Saprospiraceae bacterium]|nr:VCBS repeat-containing protein [Saprospiraceae bacterium]
MRYSILVLLVLMLVSSCDKVKKSTGQNDGKKLFELMESKHTGVSFNNKIVEIPEEHIFNFNYLYNGAGVAVGDINNDGLTDLYFTGNRAPDKLYINKGNFKFEDISTAAGIDKFSGWKTGVTMADVNGDGFLDIYVCRGGFKNDPKLNSNLLFINQKNNTFTEEGSRYNIADPGFSLACNFFDYDNDNDLDLYITNRPEQFYLDIPAVLAGKKNPGLLSSDQLYRNNGDNTFTRVTEEAGIVNNFGYGLSVTTGDLDQDGWQDIYISNDFIENDYYYKNLGNGKFKEAIREITNHTPFYAMGTDFGDMNNDGLEEIFTVEMRPEDYKRSKTSMPVMNPSQIDTMKIVGIHDQYMHNAFQLNNGNGTFSEISQLAGVDKTDWSWATLLSDFDNDGWKDIFVANGIRRDLYDRDSYGKLQYDLIHNNAKKTTEEILRNLPAAKAVNYIFKNNGDLSFSKAMNDWGIKEPSYSNGAAVADLDNDGDLDLIVNNIQDEAFIYQNHSEQNFIRVRLIGPALNPSGFGSKLTLILEDGAIQYVEMRNSRGYLSCSEPIAHFGLGNKKIKSLTVVWPDGKEQLIESPKANKVLEVNYKDASGQMNYQKSNQAGLFTELGEGWCSPIYSHKENTSFNDYKKQILLPHRLSRLGPNISVADVNGDGLEDFYVGGAMGQSGALYVQTSQQTFNEKTTAAFSSDKEYEDMGSLFFDADGDKDLDLYVVSGGTEKPEGNSYQDRIYLNDGKGNFTRAKSNLANISSSGSIVIAIDFDQDGDLDLFRGGRTVPDQYPRAPKSYLLENSGKAVFKDVTDEKAPMLRTIGMVTTAAVFQLDQDAQQELAIAGEWMPIRIFKFSEGKCKEISQELNIPHSEGWWYKLIAADIDSDGDQDLICGNLGENYKFHASPEKPFQVFANDFDHNGTYDIVLAKYNGSDMVPVRGKQCSQEQMPFIMQKFPSYNSFANAKLQDIYGTGLDSSLHLQSKQFTSMILYNNGGKLEPKNLPKRAQFSTTQGIICEDVNKDGKLDIILAGNQFSAEVETTNADAGIGTVLLNQNNREWKAINVKESGIYLPYDVKELKPIKLASSNALIVGINNSKLKLLKLN